jgi:NAD+ synthase
MKLKDLNIDEKKVAKTLQSEIKNIVSKSSAKGALIGLSGGIDSCLLTTLAVKAIGKESVHVVYLYDRDSEKDSLKKAKLLASWLGLKLKIKNIAPIMKKRGVYKPFIMRVITFSGFLNRLIEKSYYLLFKETTFKSSLRMGSNTFGKSRIKKFVYNMFLKPIVAGFYERHKYRKEFLVEMAKKEHLILIGAANRSESMVGWFVKGGIDDVKIQPLAGLYKTQVRSLSEFLDLPVEIRKQLPSPDMTKGISDEFGIGMAYARLDVILDLIQRGVSDKEILAKGITKKELDEVRELNRLSGWKRGEK